MKHYIILIFLFMIISFGCKKTSIATLPDGSTGHVINCNGTAYSWADCYNTSFSICGGEYEVISEQSGAAGEKPLRTLIIKCK